MGLVGLIFNAIRAKSTFSEASKQFINDNPQIINQLDEARTIDDMTEIAKGLSDKAVENFMNNYNVSDYLRRNCKDYMCMYLDYFVTNYYSISKTRGTKNEDCNLSLASLADYAQNEIYKKFGVLISNEKKFIMSLSNRCRFYCVISPNIIIRNLTLMNLEASFME